MSINPQRPQRQDTYDLRDQILADDNQNFQAHADATMNYGDDEEHSMLEDDSEQEENEEFIDEDDGSSSLSIPNESIDFDMVYALHSFAATVEGQANVVKGDSLFLMDDSNSYWWLVRVLKTQEVGYIPAENIETPFERLARLNKHRNIDLAAPTEIENQENLSGARDRIRNNISFGNHPDRNPSPENRTSSRTNRRRSIHFNSVRSHHRYIPPLREGEIEDEDDEWDTGGFQDEDLELAADQMYMQSMDEDDLIDAMEGDDGLQWDEDTIEALHVQGRQSQGSSIPDALQPGSSREYQEQQRLRALQQQQLLQREEQLMQERQEQQQLHASQQLAAQQTTQAALQVQQQQQAAQQRPTLRSQTSGERVTQDGSAGSGPKRIDPAEATETRKMTVTPTIAREYDERAGSQPYLPSVIVEAERSKRLRDDEPSEDLTRKKSKGKEKMAAPVSSATYNKPQPSKLRKEPSRNEKVDTDDEGKDKRKISSVFGGLFGRGKKEKNKEKNASIGSFESDSITRGSEDSSPSGQKPADGGISPTTSTAQQQQQAISLKNGAAEISSAPQTVQQAPSTPERSNTPQVSEHAINLRQRDQQHQALYQKYLNSSPSSPPEAQPSYGLQSASAVMLSSPPPSSALGPPVSRPRPGSLILTSPSSSSDAAAATLNVIRVFAGKNLPTDSTFKTVLLNSSTTSADLLRQSIQRFRLPGGEDENDYYLTIKQVVGGNYTVLQPNENALVVFDILVNEAMELPQVKRSSVGSISSISSNLSMHPAIKKLSMNDFADDSAVKFYLNRKGDDSLDDSVVDHEGDNTLTADSSHGDTERLFPGANLTPERFTSPATRFAVQVVIYAEDLPDDMQFHPQTEAIVLKASLTDPNAPILVSPNLRRKVFMFPKNITVAEVTEIGLERFGIQDGVIDGGDEVEDKLTKRRSIVRVRYGLMVSIDGHERELAPSSKIIDALPRPPQYRTPDRQNTTNKRRSLDATQLLGTVDDVRPDDPIFVLRRATSYRNSTYRRRSSAPLDEIALQQLHRESSSSYSSDLQGPFDDQKHKPSRQEIIAAQRAATRATQRAIVSASSNSVRGMDVLLPGNAMLRSSRYEVGDRMRYSYVEPDGETYDISDIVEEEWREINNDKNDLLEGVLIRNKDGIGEKLDRVLNKIKKGKGKERDLLSLSSADSKHLSTGSGSASEYSADDSEAQSRSVTPGSPHALVSKFAQENQEAVNVRATHTPNPHPARTAEERAPSRPGTTTPTAGLRANPQAIQGSRRNPSIASVMSDYSDRGTPPGQVQTPSNLSRVDEERTRGTPKSRQQRRLILPKDNFGHSKMMAIIEFKASAPNKPTPPQDPVDELLFGTPLDLESFHPSVRDIYAPGFKQLEEMDKILDGYIGRSVVGAF